jgi:hypothetical protein
MERHEHGPWDITEVDTGVERLDLGSVLVTPMNGINVQVQADQDTGAVSQLNLTRTDAMVQVQPYAAPRSGGLWEDIRGQIKSSINAGGGLVEVVEGSFGPELRAKVTPSDGSQGLQPARFVGIEGPRWFLRAVFLGAATAPGEAADALEAMVRGLVIVRGQEAMPVGAPIPLRLPQEATDGVPAGPTPPSPFERGPEITETR